MTTSRAAASASVFTDKTAAVKLYEKFGFEIEGTKRMHAYRDGRYADLYVMARIRPDMRR